MPARRPLAADAKPQFERFLETAKKIGAGETDEALDAAIRKMAPPPHRVAPVNHGAGDAPFGKQES